MKFYIKPTEEHPIKPNEYALIREGTLKLFTGEDYDKTPEDERLSKDLSQKYEIVEFEVKDKFKTKAFRVILEGSDTYKQKPLEPDIITQPCLYKNKECHQRLRFPKHNQKNANIGIIKAYKKDKDTNTFLEDFTGLNNPHNEIYTIDIEQSIQLRAFIYEEQRTYVEKVTNKNTEIKRNHALQQGNITKTIITDKSKFNDIAEEEIHWAFKIVNESYHGVNATTGRLKKGQKEGGEPFPTLGEKQSFRIHKENKPPKCCLNIQVDEKQEQISTPKLTSIPQGYVELENLQGDCIALKLSDIFDKELLKDNADTTKTLINKNIIFFAYVNQPTYHSHKKNNSNVLKDKVTSIELKILQTRFSLEFDGEYLRFYENQREIDKWEARSGIPLENLQEDSKENKQRQRFCITSKKNPNQSFYYDLSLHNNENTKPIEKGDYYIRPNTNDAPCRVKVFGNSEIGRHRLSLYGTNKEKMSANSATSYSIHGGKELGDTQGIDLAQDMKSFYKKIKEKAKHIDDIPLKVQYQKRILILIERFKQTTESTKARMNIFIDKKRVDSNGNIIVGETGEYECYNPNELPKENPYAYILERNGPDSIGGEIKLRVPSGRYSVVWKNSSKFGEVLNLKNDFVHQDRNILIHNGNTPKHSDGCLLINQTDNNEENALTNSLPAKKYFTNALQGNNGIRKYFDNIDKDEIIKHIMVIIQSEEQK